MYRRYTLSPPMEPENLSDYVDKEIIEFSIHHVYRKWPNPLRDFRSQKNLIDILMSNLGELVKLYRPNGNQNMINRAITHHCDRMTVALKKWDNQKNAAFAGFDEYQQGTDIEELIELYYPRALAKNYLFTISALYAFDKKQNIIKLDALYEIYHCHETFEQLQECFKPYQNIYNQWKEKHQENIALTQSVDHLIQYLEKKLNIRPFKSVRFKL